MGLLVAFVGFGLGIVLGGLLESQGNVFIVLLQWELVMVEWVGMVMASMFLPTFALQLVCRRHAPPMELMALGVCGLMLPMIGVVMFPDWPRTVPEHLVYWVLGGSLS